MSMKYFTLFILLLPLQIIEAQPEKGTYWGVAWDAGVVFENNSGINHYEILPPPNIYLHIGDSFNRYMNINIFAGYMPFSSNWDGFDFGFALKPQIINRLYFSAGIFYSTTSAGSGEGNFAPIYYQKNFTYGSLGLGCYVTKIAYIEFNYAIPLNSDKIYGYANTNNYYIQTNQQLKLVSRIKLDFGWDFSF